MHWLLRALLHLALSTIALILIAKFVNGIELTSIGAAVFAAIVMGIVNFLVRPLMIILTLPVTVITLGLFLLVVNAAMFGLAALLSPGFSVHGFVPALIGGFLYWLASLAIHWLLKQEKSHEKGLAKAK